MKSKAVCVEELTTVLLSYRTNSRSSTGETPFTLTYDLEAVPSLKILSKSLQVTGFNANTNEAEHRQDLDVLDKKREAT